MLAHGLLEDASQAITSALLSLEVAVRPVMQQPAKPGKKIEWLGFFVVCGVLNTKIQIILK